MKQSPRPDNSPGEIATRQRHRDETRSQLLERLTNPLISLHEAGVILNVCASTLRRYSDSGLLPHERTAGGQRRFHLKHVLNLLDEREKQRQDMRRRRTRGRVRNSQVRNSQVRVEARKTAPASALAPLLSERERREIEGRKVLEAARARLRLSQAAVQKNQARDTPPARLPLSRLSSLGRAQMRDDEAQHKSHNKAQNDDD